MTQRNYNAHFRTQYFDCEQQQGLMVELRNGKRFAIRISPDLSYTEIADGLRSMADKIVEGALLS